MVYFCICLACASIGKFSITLKYHNADSCAKAQLAGYRLKLQGNFIIFHHLLTMTLMSNIEKGFPIVIPLLKFF